MEKGREKRKSTLSISSRVSHSKNFEAKQHESTRGNTRPRQFPSLNSRGAKYSTDIRVNGAFWPSKYQRKDIPSPFQRRSIESKVVWKCCRLPLDAHPLRDDYARPPSIHATHLCLRLCTGAIYTLFLSLSSLLLLSSSAYPGYPVAARVCASHGPACNPRIDCANVARRLLFRGQPCILAYATF